MHLSLPMTSCKQVGRLHDVSGAHAKLGATAASPTWFHHSETGHGLALDLLRRCTSDVQLDLTGLVVVTNVADGIAATAAALGGAKRVIAVRGELKRRSRAAEARRWQLHTSDVLEAAGRIEIVTRMDLRAWHEVDILVNGFELGPVSRSVIELLPSTAVVALTAEPWEIPPRFIDIDACAEVGVQVTAPNLRHPAIDQLPELARLCCRLICSAGLHPRGAKIAVLCDTPCGPFIERALADLGADVETFPHPLLVTRDDWAAVVVALRPSEKPSMDINGLAATKENAPGALLVQFSGEIDRIAARYFGLRLWPERKPARGQLGLAAEALGMVPVFRRVIGGIKAAAAVRRGAQLAADDIGFVVDSSSMSN
jgi:hypothetical protein